MNFAIVHLVRKTIMSNVYGCLMASGSASAGIWILKVRCHRLHVTSEFATAKFRSYTGKFD